jgi:hypothetical protein
LSRLAGDHEIVRLAQGQFEAFLTIDRGFEFEHDLKKLTFGIVIIHVPKNRIAYYRPLFPALIAAVEKIGPGQLIHVRA